MSLLVRRLMVCLSLAALSACATTTYNSTWSAPDAQPVGNLEGQMVVALVLVKNASSRRVAEDTLAQQLSANGAKGVAGYTMLPDDIMGDEARVRAVIEKAGASGIVVMRPLAREKEIVSTPTAMYAGPMYGPFWGGYYPYGWGGAWPAQEIRTDTIVSVETLVYSLKQNKLLWAGQSETTNPSRVDAFVRELASSAAREMRRAGLL